MLPLRTIVSVGYAYHSGTADTAHFAMPDADWSIKGDTIYHINGNVGIGTTSPTQRLDVRGNIHASAIGIGPNTPWATNGIYLDAGSQGTPIFWSDRSDCDFYIYEDGAANTLYFKSSGGGSWEQWKWVSAGLGDLFTVGPNIIMNRNVGIGTTSPTQKLQINSGNVQMTWGDNAYSLMGGLRFGTSYNNWDDWAGIEGWTYGGLDQSYLRFYTTFGSRSEKMCIMPSGNVGIGTTNPEFKLDVAGDIRSTGTIYGNFSGTINNALLWNGHTWGDTYPYSSNSDMVDGVHGTSFLRNDQSGTLNGSLTVNGPGGSINAITGNTNGDYSGVAGVNTGTGPGVYGETYSSAGNGGGVHGRARVDGGSGVYGETWSLGVSLGSSVAVYGWAPQAGASVGGAALGVLGRVNSYQGTSASVPSGVFGWATATSGVNAGVFGQTDSPDGFGVYSKGKLEVNGNINTNGTITAGSSSSNLGIGTYSPTHRIDVQGGAYCNGTNWVNASSRKYKKDISSLTPDEYQDILEKLLETDVVRYQYKSESNGKVHIGIIAEDAPEEIVDTERTGIPTGDAIGFLLAALKAQQEEIKDLKVKLEKLESKR